MHSTAERAGERAQEPKPRRNLRVQRHFSSQRQARELVRDLLRAHSGEE